MTLDQHVSLTRRQPVAGIHALVSALRSDRALQREAKARLAGYAGFTPERLAACWISRTTQEVLKAAFAQMTLPDVPAGATDV